MRSVGVALFRTRPDRVHAARCRPCASRGSWHPLQTASVIGNGKFNVSKSNTRNKYGGTVHSGVVGACANTIPAFRPECVRKCAWREGGRPVSIELFLKEVSRTEEAQYCQPCGHSLPKHPPMGSSRLSLPRTSWATSGVRWLIMCKASAHDAQYAAGAHLAADRNPRGRDRFWPIRFWPSLFDHFWPIHFWPIHFWPIHFSGFTIVRPRRVGAKKRCGAKPRKSEAQKGGWGPERWEAQNFALFFDPLPPHFRSFCLSLGVFS